MPKHNGIFYADRGAGPATLLIHGFCERSEVWEEIASQLEGSFRVIALDVPGFGKSELPHGEVTLPLVAKEILKFIEGIGVATCNLVGHSMGGYIALEMFRQKPETTNSLVLFQSTALADTDEKKVSRNKVIDFIKRNGVPQFIKSFIPPLFYDTHHPAIEMLVKIGSETPQTTVIKYTEAMRDRRDQTDVLKTSSIPILMLAGSHDPGIPVESSRMQASMAKNGEMHVAEGVGHMGMVENPKLTGNILSKFLLDSC